MKCTCKIACAGCHKQYLGQTRDILRNRLTVYRQQINNPELRQISLITIWKYVEKIQKSSKVPFLKMKAREQLLRNTS